MNYKERFDETVNYLKNKNKILFLTTSNRWVGELSGFQDKDSLISERAESEEKGELPKSSLLAKKIAEKVGLNKVKIIDVTKLKIYVCEGNVSGLKGNSCGVKDAVLKDKEKNPSGCHRCWASINNPDD